VPLWVIPLHRTECFTPLGVFCWNPKVSGIAGGLQILHGVNPSSTALSISISADTFSTMWHVAKWYRLPKGVLYTFCASVSKANSNNKSNNRHFGTFIVFCFHTLFQPL
jgi:hypothetical protein